MFWKSEGWHLQDRHLEGLRTAPFQRKLPPIQLSPGVSIIRGPRQVGKSTWLKLLLKEKLDLGAKCFYTSCEDLGDYQDLGELLRSQKDVDYFFLDEITFVTEWWRAIKKAVDSSANVTFVLTGSNSNDLKQGLDLMPGRWSTSAGELYLLPMLFDEWCGVRKEANWPELSKLDALKGFMKVGGFPAAVAEAGADFKPIEHSKKTYERWILGDVAKLNRQEVFMKELLGQLAKTMGSSISLQGLAQKTQLMSYHTVQDYISILERAFAVRTFYAYDPNTDSFRFKKEKKFYFTDPIIYWIALEMAGMKIPDDPEEQLAEMIAAEWLSRKHKRLGYYSSKEGEVDFISQRDFAIEVKWAPVVHNLSKAYKNLIIANKMVWHQNNFFDID